MVRTISREPMKLSALVLYEPFGLLVNHSAANCTDKMLVYSRDTYIDDVLITRPSFSGQKHPNEIDDCADDAAGTAQNGGDGALDRLAAPLARAVPLATHAVTNAQYRQREANYHYPQERHFLRSTNGAGSGQAEAAGARGSARGRSRGRRTASPASRYGGPSCRVSTPPWLAGWS